MSGPINSLIVINYFFQPVMIIGINQSEALIVNWSLFQLIFFGISVAFWLLTEIFFGLYDLRIIMKIIKNCLSSFSVGLTALTYFAMF